MPAVVENVLCHSHEQLLCNIAFNQRVLATRIVVGPINVAFRCYM